DEWVPNERLLGHTKESLKLQKKLLKENEVTRDRRKASTKTNIEPVSLPAKTPSTKAKVAATTPTKTSKQSSLQATRKRSTGKKLGKDNENVPDTPMDIDELGLLQDAMDTASE